MPTKRKPTSKEPGFLHYHLTIPYSTDQVKNLKNFLMEAHRIADFSFKIKEYPKFPSVFACAVKIVDYPSDSE